MFRGLLFGGIAAALLGVLWGLAGGLAGAPLSLIAIPVGIAIGFATAYGAREHVDVVTGLAAVTLTAGSITIARGITHELLTHRAAAAINEEIAAEIRSAEFTEADAVAYMARTLADQPDANGSLRVYPEGYTYKTATEPEHFPAGVHADAAARWKAMSQDARNHYADAAREVVVAERLQDHQLGHADAGELVSDVQEGQYGEERGRRGRRGGIIPAFAIFYLLGAVAAYLFGSGESGGDR